MEYIENAMVVDSWWNTPRYAMTDEEYERYTEVCDERLDQLRGK